MLIFILGNGPSLTTQREFMPRVGNYPTFCCNRMNQWDGLCFTPTYYACNHSIVEGGLEPKFPPYSKVKYIISPLKTDMQGWTSRAKDGNVPLRLWCDTLRCGGTMPYIMAQIAVHLGYKRLFFLGIEQQGTGHCFDIDGKNNQYNVPRQDKLFPLWEMMKEYYEGNGIKLRDCTPNGRLNDILEYQPLEGVLNG